MQKLQYLYISILAVIVFLGMMIFACYNLYKLSNFNKNTIKTNGTIIGYNSKTGYAKLTKNRKLVYAPIFSFITKDKKNITIESIIFTKTKSHKKGETVQVYYNKNNPRMIKITKMHKD